MILVTPEVLPTSSLRCPNFAKELVCFSLVVLRKTRAAYHARSGILPEASSALRPACSHQQRTSGHFALQTLALEHLAKAAELDAGTEATAPAMCRPRNERRDVDRD